VADRGSMPPGASWIGLLVRRDLVGQIRDYADLRGRKISINQIGTTNDIAIEAALKRGGLTMADADIQQIPYSDMNAALSNRNIDVAQQNEPFKAIAIEQGLGTFFHGVDEYYPNMQFSVVLFGPQFVRTILRRPNAGWSASCAACATITTRSARGFARTRRFSSSRSTYRCATRGCSTRWASRR